MAAAGEDPEEPLDDSEDPETPETERTADDSEMGDVAGGADVETETAAATRSRMNAAKLQALEDVFARMTKRLTTAAGRIKRPDQLAEFRSRLDTDHLQVITAALSPIVPLCGGDDAGPFAVELVTAFRSRLDSLVNAPDLHAAVESLGETFVQDAGQFASEALRKMVA
jgi:hypothetical protein